MRQNTEKPFFTDSNKYILKTNRSIGFKLLVFTLFQFKVHVLPIILYMQGISVMRRCDEQIIDAVNRQQKYPKNFFQKNVQFSHFALLLLLRRLKTLIP